MALKMIMLTAAALAAPAADAEMLYGIDISDKLNYGRQSACGTRPIEDSDRPELRWDDQLAQAAASHAEDMASKGYFRHAALDGTTVDSRVTATGYDWKAVGEILAKGHKNFDSAVHAWLKSNKHCEVLVDPSFLEYGAAAFKDNTGKIYWVVVFGQRRKARKV